jgi:hypothetical protein
LWSPNNNVRIRLEENRGDATTQSNLGDFGVVQMLTENGKFDSARESGKTRANAEDARNYGRGTQTDCEKPTDPQASKAIRTVLLDEDALERRSE